MKIVLACPPIRDFYITPHRLVSLGTEALKTVLEKAGHQVAAFNFPLGDGGCESRLNSRTIPLPGELHYLKPFIIDHETGPASFFIHYKHWGPEFTECAKRILNQEPGLLCISSFAFAYAQEAVWLSRAVKEHAPSLFILAGGPGPTASPDHYLEDSGIDAVLSGEGEETLPLFCRLLEQHRGTEDFYGIPGLHQKSGKARNNRLELPKGTNEPDVVIAKGRILNGKRFYAVSLARGCPKQCAFCSNHLVQGRQFRHVSLDRLESGLDRLSTQCEVESRQKNCVEPIHFNFEDDNLLIDPPFFLQAIVLFRRYFPSATFSAENGLDYMLLTTDLIEELSKAGFTQFNLSLVSQAEGVLDRLHRPHALTRFKAITEGIASRPLPVIAYFIAGFTEDTKDGVARTLAFLASMPVRVGFSPLYAVPGTADFNAKYLDAGLAPRLSLGSSLFPWTGALSTKTLVTAFRLARTVNLMANKREAAANELVRKIVSEKRLWTIVKEKKTIKNVPVPEMDEELIGLFFKYWNETI